MAQILRQSTQVVVRIGPFMDATDAVTPETGITLGAADQAEALKAAGAATADISGNTWAAITGAGGWYDLTLTTTDTNTLGTLDIVVQDTSVCLPVFARFQVIEEAAYDAIYATSASPATTTGAVGSVTGAVGSVTGAVGSVTGAVGSIASGGITTASFAAGAINAAAIAADAIGASELAADAVAEIADAIWDEDATAHQTLGTFGQAIGDPVADAGTIYGAVVTGAAGADIAADIVAVKADTAAILIDTAEIGAAGAGLTSVGLANGAITAAKFGASAIDAAALATDAVTEIQAGLAPSANVSAVETDTQDIQARLPAALTVAGNIKSDALAMNGTTVLGAGTSANKWRGS